jgi:hypothetical protein
VRFFRIGTLEKIESMNLASSAEDERLLINDVDYEMDRANARNMLERSHRSHKLGGGSRDDFLGKIVASPVRTKPWTTLQAQSFFSILHNNLLVSTLITVCSCICPPRSFGYLSHFALGIGSYI